MLGSLVLQSILPKFVGSVEGLVWFELPLLCPPSHQYPLLLLRLVMPSRRGVLTPEIRWRSFLPLLAFLSWRLSCRVTIFPYNHCYCTTISWWAAGVVGEQASWEVAGSRGPSRCRGRQQVVVGPSR